MNILIKIFGGTYDDLWKAIIRPNKDEYTQDELGPFKFEFKGKCYKRTDFELINKRSQKIECSFWEPFDEEREKPRLPCVIYLHGNSSSRCEAYPEVKYLLQRNITVFSFDFCGCGKSEGEYISLGYYEKKDVHCVIEYLLKSKKVSKIGLWGRSMGAVTAIMYANEHPQLIDAMILDSGFYSLKQLIKELIDSKIKLPSFIYDKVLNLVKETVKEKAKFDLDIIEPYIYAKNCLVPAFFCHGNDDNFVLPHHCKDLFNDYKCKDKICEIVKGSHNSSRPKDLKNKICDFLEKYLNEDDLQSNATINNSNTYERIDINKILKASSVMNIVSKSVNKINLNRKNNRNDNTIQINKNNNNSFRDYLNGSKIDENFTNNNNYNVNASENMRAYSQNKYSNNNLMIINKKNTVFNINRKKNINKYKIEENISSSSSSSNKDEKSQVYKKKHPIKEPFNSIKIKTVSNCHYFNDSKSKIDINKFPIVNKNIYVKNKRKINNIINNTSKSSKTKNSKSNKKLANSFLNSVIMSSPNVKNYKNVTISNSILNNNKVSRNLKINRNINKSEKIFSDNFLIESSDSKNIIQNNYYYTNNIYLNRYLRIKPKNNEPIVNFSYTSKKPLDKYLFKSKIKDKISTRKEIKKSLLFKSIDIKNSKDINLISNSFKSNIKRQVYSHENSVLEDNEETLGRNFPY